jgi:hypothetical protein
MTQPPFETSAALAALPGIRHGFFGRQSGTGDDLNVSDVIGDPDEAAENRRVAATALGITPPFIVVRLKQIHSDRVMLIGPDYDTSRQPEADGHATDVPGRALAIVTADCAPILFADAEAGIVGACHAGREGALSGVLENTITAMMALGADPDRIVAAIGPSISGPNYEIGPELAAELKNRDPDIQTFIEAPENGREHFDLPAYVEARLASIGLAKVERVGGCTYADPARYFSHRHFTHSGVSAGRQISMISIAR